MAYAPLPTLPLITARKESQRLGISTQELLLLEVLNIIFLIQESWIADHVEFQALVAHWRLTKTLRIATKDWDALETTTIEGRAKRDLNLCRKKCQQSAEFIVSLLNTYLSGYGQYFATKPEWSVIAIDSPKDCKIYPMNPAAEEIQEEYRNFYLTKELSDGY